MGSRATALIWYGVPVSWDDNELPSKVIELLKTDKAYDPEDEDLDSNYISPFLSFNAGGLEYTQFVTDGDGDSHGFGVVIYETDWDESPALFNLDEIKEKLMQEVVEPVEQAFQSWGITAKPLLYVTCRYW